MRKLTSIWWIFVLVSGVLTTLSSCVNDQQHECPPAGNVRLWVRLDTEDTRGNPNRYEVENVTLYVFDRNNRFEMAWQGGAYTVGEGYEIILNLDPDEYQFVIWTNLSDDYYKTSFSLEECYEQRPLLSEMITYLDLRNNAAITSEIPDLLYGIYRKAVVKADQYNEFLVRLTPNTYKLNFTVEGLEVSNHDFEFLVEDNNSHYTFDNSIVANRNDFRYMRSSVFQEDKLTASIKVLRLTKDRQPLFEFTNTSQAEVLYSNNLVDMILNAYEQNGQTLDFNTTFEFDIRITFQTDMSTIVSINGWKVIQQAPGELE